MSSTLLEKYETIRNKLLVQDSQHNRFLRHKSNKYTILFETTTAVQTAPVQYWETIVEEKKPLQIRELSPSALPNTPLFDDANKLEEPEETETTKNILYYKHTRKDGKKALRELQSEAEKIIEERGVNLLQLVMYSVSWQEDVNGKKTTYRAPLLLIPVTLDASPRKKQIKIHHTGDEIEINQAFINKLDNTDADVAKNIRKDLDTIENIHTLSSDLSAVDSAEIKELLTILEKHLTPIEWQIEPTVFLDILEATDFQIYQDLAPENWNIPTHHTISNLLQTGCSTDLQRLAIQQANIEKQVQSPEQLQLVLDADPSQLRAVVTASQGINLVIQGPPGTGKSQTIVNIMTHLVSQGKTVLFVAQKKAALDVVQERLHQHNIREMVLELHSTKQNKRAVLQSIEESLEQKSVLAQTDPHTRPTTENFRKKLDTLRQHAQQTLGNTGRHIGDIISRYLDLRKKMPKQYPPVYLAEAIHWTPSNVQSIVYQLEHYQHTLFSTTTRSSNQEISDISSWSDNPFRYGSLQEMSPLEQQHFLTHFQEARKALAHVVDIYTQYVEDTGFSFALSWQGIHDFCTTLQECIDKPDISGITKTSRSDIENLLKLGYTLTQQQHRLTQVFDETALFRLPNLRAYITYVEENQHVWWRHFSWKWYSTIRLIAGYFRNKQTLAIEDWHKPLEDLAHFHEKYYDFEEISYKGKLAFKKEWKHIHSDWEALQDTLDWTDAVEELQQQHPLLLQTRFLQKDGYQQQAKKMLENTQNAITAYNQAIAVVQNTLHIDQYSPLHPTQHQDALQHVLSYLQTPHATGENLTFALNCQHLRKGLWDLGLQELLQNVEDNLVYFEQHNHLLRDIFLVSIDYTLVQYIQKDPILQQYTVASLLQLQEQFAQHDRALQAHSQETLLQQHSACTQSLFLVDELLTLHQEIKRRRPTRSIRSLLQTTGDIIQALKPIFMMSPISVATNLPSNISFDTVIFDEASQLTVTNALGSILRAKQIIVVGDSQQMPPSNFFQKREENEQSFEDMESILNLALAAQCPQITLSYHYRSRHPDLIAVSNAYMYKNGLLPFPSPNNHPLATGVSIHMHEESVYDRGGNANNPIEAGLVVEHLLEIITANQQNYSPSIGIVAFSNSQRACIQDAFDLLCVTKPILQQYKAAEPLFIKNLEDVQGDERDIIIISVGYGIDATGKFNKNFGPITQQGGDRRLNVLFTRARFAMHVFCNFPASALQSSDNRGLQMLGSLLQFHTPQQKKHIPDANKFREDIAEFIASIGYKVSHSLGDNDAHTGNTIDIAVHHPTQKDTYIVAILCDQGSWYRHENTRYRERLFPQTLRSFGWNVYYVWAMPWYKNTGAEKERLQRAVQQAMQTPISTVQQRTPNFAVRRHHSAISRSIDIQAPPSIDTTRLRQNIPPNSKIDNVDTVLLHTLRDILSCNYPLHIDTIFDICYTIYDTRSGKNINATISKALQTLCAQSNIVQDGKFYMLGSYEIELRVPPTDIKEIHHIYPAILVAIIRHTLKRNRLNKWTISSISKYLIEILQWTKSGKQEQVLCSLVEEFTEQDRLQIENGYLYTR